MDFNDPMLNELVDKITKGLREGNRDEAARYMDIVIEQYPEVANILMQSVEFQNIMAENEEAVMEEEKAQEAQIPIQNRTDEERQAFLSVTSDIGPEHPLFLFVIMYHTGLRPSEVIRLLGSDIMKIDGKNVLRVRGEKTGAADRYVPLPDSLYNLIKGTCSGSLIVRKKEHMFDKNDYDNAGRMLKRRMKRAGITSDFCPYMLRHDYCTRLKKQGVSLRDAQYLMGHSKIAITAEIYTHVTASEVLANL